VKLKFEQALIFKWLWKIYARYYATLPRRPHYALHRLSLCPSVPCPRTVNSKTENQTSMFKLRGEMHKRYHTSGVISETILRSKGQRST